MWQSLSEMLAKQWWVYSAEATDLSHFYHWFNIVEGTIWCLIGLFVFRRYLENQHCLSEVAYGVGFFLFGISDFVEAQGLYTWLILYKALNIIALLGLRRHLLRRHYTEAKWI